MLGTGRPKRSAREGDLGAKSVSEFVAGLAPEVSAPES